MMTTRFIMMRSEPTNNNADDDNNDDYNNDDYNNNDDNNNDDNNNDDNNGGDNGGDESWCSCSCPDGGASKGVCSILSPTDGLRCGQTHAVAVVPTAVRRRGFARSFP